MSSNTANISVHIFNTNQMVNCTNSVMVRNASCTI